MVGFKDRTRIALPVSTAEQHSMRSFLFLNGISQLGANQFVNGEYVSDANDRKLLAQLMTRLVKGPA
jgi:hypothetical protein